MVPHPPNNADQPLFDDAPDKNTRPVLRGDLEAALAS